MERRGAPLPKKSKQPHHNNTKNGAPIVVVESHKKFITAKQKEIEESVRSSA